MNTFWKKLTSLLLLAVVATPLVATAAPESVEYIANGTFEEISAKGVPANWGYAGPGINGTDYIAETENVKTGDVALCIKGENIAAKTSYHASQMVEGVHENAEYTFSMWFSANAIHDKATVQITYLSGNIESQVTILGQEIHELQDVRYGKWQKLSFPIATPKKTRAIIIMLRLYGGGEVYFDDVSLICTTPGLTDHKADMGYQPYPAEYENFPPLPGTGEMLTNTSMEEVTNEGGAKNWGAYKGWGGGIVSVTDKIAHTGSRSISIDGGGNPWINQTVQVKGGQKLQLSYWVNINGKISGKGFGTKFEAYNSPTEQTAETAILGADQVNGYIWATKGEWMYASYTYNVPFDAQSVSVYVRLYGTGTAYVDDVSVLVVGDERGEDYTFMTDRVFYYEGEDLPGWAHVTISDNYPELAKGTVDFGLYDGETLLTGETGVPFTEDVIIDGKSIQSTNKDDGYAAKKAEFQFDPSIMTELRHDYYMRAVARDAEGNIVREFMQRLCMYNRPKALREDGVYIIDGKPFMPVLGYHLYEEEYAEAKKMGVNTALIGIHIAAYLNHPDYIDNTLKLLEENDMYGILCLYRNMAPAGSEVNFENTRLLVSYLRGNDRIIGYAVMDEPSLNSNSHRDLYNSYRIIRDSDPEAVVYTVDCVPNSFYDTARFADISAFDPYPCASTLAQITSFGAEHVKLAFQDTYYRKPIYNIVQTYEALSEHDNPLFPTAEEVRVQLYQSLFAGAHGLGYYAISDGVNHAGKDTSREKGTSILKSDRWEGLSKIGPELAEAAKAFVTGEYPTIYESMSGDAWYKLYAAGDEIHAVIMSVSDTETREVSLPLQSFDGTMKVGDYSAEIIWGGNEKIAGNGVLKHTLLPCTAVVYKITPKENVDLSNFENGRFIDLGEYPWARAQIESLDKKGIVNEDTVLSYAPAKEITRGELAMFLVRTLGLTGDASESFADVDKNAEYAKEIAIGKQAGILQGIGGNRFNPEEQITRQDLMTMIARGLSLSATTDLSAFSDGAQIADYARPYVESMIAEGLIKGNADGSINPLGNTTRAEAAVLMDRILKMHRR